MFVQPRNDLDEVAAPRAIIELGVETPVPAIAAGAGRTRQAEDEGRACNARRCATLDRRRPDLGMAQHMKGDGKAVHPLLKQRLDCFRRYVAAGKAGPAGSDDGIDAFVRDPALDDDADRIDVIDDDLPRGELVPGGDDP